MSVCFTESGCTGSPGGLAEVSGLGLGSNKKCLFVQCQPSDSSSTVGSLLVVCEEVNSNSRVSQMEKEVGS